MEIPLKCASFWDLTMIVKGKIDLYFKVLKITNAFLSMQWNLFLTLSPMAFIPTAAAASPLSSGMAAGSFSLCFMILLSFAAISRAVVELGTATLWNSYNSSASLCDAITSQVPADEMYAAAGYYLFKDGTACGTICTVTCTAAIGEPGNCVANNNIAVAVKIIDGISDTHPLDKTLAMRLSGPALSKLRVSKQKKSLSITIAMEGSGTVVLEKRFWYN